MLRSRATIHSATSSATENTPCTAVHNLYIWPAHLEALFGKRRSVLITEPSPPLGF